jgi:hypothetical protein
MDSTTPKDSHRASASRSPSKMRRMAATRSVQAFFSIAANTGSDSGCWGWATGSMTAAISDTCRCNSFATSGKVAPSRPRLAAIFPCLSRVVLFLCTSTAADATAGPFCDLTNVGDADAPLRAHYLNVPWDCGAPCCLQAGRGTHQSCRKATSGSTLSQKIAPARNTRVKTAKVGRLAIQVAKRSCRRFLTAV